jgi:hypothetical protein
MLGLKRTSRLRFSTSEFDPTETLRLGGAEVAPALASGQYRGEFTRAA